VAPVSTTGQHVRRAGAVSVAACAQRPLMTDYQGRTAGFQPRGRSHESTARTLIISERPGAATSHAATDAAVDRAQARHSDLGI